MKTISIGKLRKRWPEKELQVESEIIVTKYGKPVARLISLGHQNLGAKRWDAKAHLRWLKQTWKNKQVALVDKYLLIDRNERPCRKGFSNWEISVKLSSK